VALLGIVELVIFLLYKFDAGLDKKAKEVFADVHFTLFFTALFNAFQSGILAFFISRNSYRLWVKIEYQDLHHYVEIREEFDAVCKKLSRTLLGEKSRRIFNADSDSRSNLQSLPGLLSSVGLLGEIKFMLTNLEKLWELLKQKARYPRLSRRYQSLLIQIRFHELKFQFIQANNLPITLRISDYMKRCERHILLKMVHISLFKWLILTGAVELLYFIFGTITYHTDGNLMSTRYTMIVLFFGSMIFFVLLSLIIWNKISWIFHTIIHTNLISFKTENQDDVNNSSHVTNLNDIKEFDQLSLFWGRNTKYITIMIQFMQLGFALALSILLIFWLKIDPKEDDTEISGYYYLVCVLLCFSCFVYIMSHAVPRFTLCSSIGQMVDKERLYETLARHRLEVALRERQLILLEEKHKASFQKNPEDFKIHCADSMALPPQKANISLSRLDPTLLQELVNTRTEDLRKNLPSQDAYKLDESKMSLRGRRNRHKTLSDG
jgi:hypothetical protein